MSRNKAKQADKGPGLAGVVIGSIGVASRNRRLLFALGLYVLVCLVLTLPRIGSVKYAEGDIAEADIVSPRSIEYTDTFATRKAKVEAAASVGTVYRLSPSFQEEIGEVFQLVLDSKGLDPGSDEYRDVSGTLFDFGLGAETVRTMLGLDGDSAVQLWLKASAVVRRISQEGTIDDRALLRIEENAARYAREESLEPELIPVIQDIVSVSIKRSLDEDFEATEQLRNEAVSGMPDVVHVIKTNEIIVRKGDPITPRHMDILKQLGMTSVAISWATIVGGLLIVAIAFLIVGSYIRTFSSFIYYDEKRMLIFYILVLIAVLWSVMVNEVPTFSGYLVAVSAGVLTILVCILLKPMLSLVAVPALIFPLVLVLDMDMGHFLVALVASLVAYYYSVRKMDQDSMMKAGVAIAISNMVVIFILSVMQHIELEKMLIEVFVFGSLNGLLTFVLATGLMPVFERVFNVTTPHRLLELSNPEEPLLKRMLIEAPGTYHHSILVGNLAETAAEVVGANTLLVRIVCYYHDVGKLKRPYFFVENQMGGTSQLSEMAPTLGALVISSHVKDGVEMGKEAGLPDDVIEIMQEHHGTMLISFFYQQAQAEAKEGTDVSEERFRYPGPKPHRIESAIIMMADSCEAAVRSQKNPTPKSIESTVNSIVEARLLDGQFDQCEITLKQIDTIRLSLIKTLASVYHSRMEYPDLEELKLQKAESLRRNGNGDK